MRKLYSSFCFVNFNDIKKYKKTNFLCFLRFTQNYLFTLIFFFRVIEISIPVWQLGNARQKICLAS